MSAVGTMTQEGSLNPLSIEASYKRFLRPSLCQKSSFLNKQQPLSFEKAEDKAEYSYPRQADMEIIPPTSEFEGEMLLSQKKDPESQKQEEPAPTEAFLLSGGAEEGQHVEGRRAEERGEQLYPLI